MTGDTLTTLRRRSDDTLTTAESAFCLRVADREALKERRHVARRPQIHTTPAPAASTTTELEGDQSEAVGHAAAAGFLPIENLIFEPPAEVGR